MTYSVEREFKDGEFEWGSISIYLLHPGELEVIIFNLQHESHQTCMHVTFPKENSIYETILCVLNKLTDHLGNTGTDGIVFGYEDYIWSSLENVKLPLCKSNINVLMPTFNQVGKFVVQGCVTSDFVFTYDGEPWKSPL